MQGRDIVKIETEFVRDIVSKLIEKALRQSDVGIQIGKLKIVTEDAHIHLNGNAEINIKWKKYLKILPNKLIEKFISEWLKKKCGGKAVLRINDKKYIEKDGKSCIYFDTDVEIKMEELEKILLKVNLI